MKPRQLDLVDYNQMVDLYRTESDRGAAVLAGSYVENVIGELLVHTMTDKSLADELFGTDGPLSTFSQRIRIAQAFGAVSVSTAAALHLIRKIRNHFAHHPQNASFDDSPVKDWIRALLPFLPPSTEQETHSYSNRHIYLLSCGFFSVSTHIRMVKPSEYMKKAKK